ncbi:MAG TPA: MbtH family NRPS accessory protein [Polyangiaceae bacterium]|nr:MbtH family NRPS accessory protein [Polyangiaceae bacterium]
MSFDSETIVFVVVVNHEEQYSIWPEYKPIPNGWRDAGKRGVKKECLEYIDRVWTDMRPLSLRRQMDGDAQTSGGHSKTDDNQPTGGDVLP